MNKRLHDGGFTLTELMVVIAIVGILASLAVAAPEESSATVDGTAAAISAELDATRLRSMTTHRWQRAVFSGGDMVIQQGDTTGMVPPTTWTQSKRIDLERGVQVVSIAAASYIDPTGSAAPGGTGLAAGIVFAPDGSSGARTLYLQSERGTDPTRLVVFEATGSVFTRDGW